MGSLCFSFFPLQGGTGLGLEEREGGSEEDEGEELIFDEEREVG